MARAAVARGDERQKLLEAYYAKVMPLDLFATEQARTQRGIDHANEVMMLKDYNLRQVERTVSEAIELAGDWGRAYREAPPSIRRQINQAFFRCFVINSTGTAGAVVSDEFASMVTEDLVRRFERQTESALALAAPTAKALPAPLVTRGRSPFFSGVVRVRTLWWT